MPRSKSVRAIARRKKLKIIRYRIKDVGRKGYHYLQIAVVKQKGKKGGRTIATLITKKELERRIEKARRKLIKLRKRKKRK